MPVTVTIDTPAPDANVPGNGSFHTFGRVSPTMGTSMSAQVIDGSNTFGGTAYPPPPHSPAYNWGFSFTGVPTGHPVELKVTGVNGSESGSKTISITCTNP